MYNTADKKELELLCVIVNFGLGSKVVKIAKQNVISGSTVILGKGTIKNHLMVFLDLTDSRKEIVLMISEKTMAYNVLEILNKELNLKKPNHGIAFITSVKSLFGSRSCYTPNIKESRGVKHIMYNAIFIVVDKGKAEDTIQAANKAGSRGGTIINARGSGIHEVSKLFFMNIEPEKEMVMILSEINLTESITSSIRKQLQLDEPGNGIMFILDVNETYGLY